MKTLFIVFALTSFSAFLFLSFYTAGYRQGRLSSEVYPNYLTKEASSKELSSIKNENPKKTDQPSQPTLQPTVQRPAQPKYFSGPQLWEAVNKRRKEFGVSSLSQKDELCTIASIRLNELLNLGTLDGHEGFSSLPTRRPDLNWIFEKYNISEFLLVGADTAQEAVGLWENTLGHKKLLTGGEYVWGCIYAQNSFGVAITAY